MNAAAYLIILRKRHLLDWTFILTFIVWGSVGMLLGLSVASPASIAPTEWPPGIVPPGLANILFGTLVLCFAIMYGYTADVLPALTPTASKEVPSGVAVAPPSLPTILFLQMGMVVAAIAGGFLSANVGSGSDMYQSKGFRTESRGRCLRHRLSHRPARAAARCVRTGACTSSARWYGTRCTRKLPSRRRASPRRASS